MSNTEPNYLVVFRTRLGWMAMIGAGDVLRQLTLAHARASEAAAAVGEPKLAGRVRRGTWNSPLVERLRAYAAGTPDDFRDVPVDVEHLSEFQRRVFGRCRDIPLGSTLSYGQLAAGIGSPGAARAVGNCMAANRIPLVIPCHRVLRADGCLGSYSAPGGIATKRRLLRIERALPDRAIAKPCPGIR